MITNYNYHCTLIPAIKRERGNFLKIPCGSQLSPILKINRNPIITINLLLTEVICYPLLDCPTSDSGQETLFQTYKKFPVTKNGSL